MVVLPVPAHHVTHIGGEGGMMVRGGDDGEGEGGDGEGRGDDGEGEGRMMARGLYWL